jgi:hypothetical protein
MNYPLLKRGDKLPSVGVLQLLLNSTGNALAVDGSFGSKTEAALKAFQSARHIYASGIVDCPTWTRLTHSRRLPIVDCVDVFDSKILVQRVGVLQKAGTEPLLTGGMQYGIQAVLDGLAAYGGDLCQLRIVGHGGSGMQAISFGAGGFREWNPHTRTMEFVPLQGPFEGVGLQTAAQIEQLAPLSHHLGPYGHIELHGCKVAAGTKGRDFVTLMAHKLGIPVSAGTGKQPMASAFRITGHVFTALPGAHSLKTWCASRPAFTPKSLP